MIEQAHMEAMRVAANRGKEAVINHDISSARTAFNQLAALNELEQARQEIFAEYNVSDIESDYNIDQKSIAVLKRAMAKDRVSADSVADYESLNFIQTLRKLRGVTPIAEVARKSNLDPAYLGRVERQFYNTPRDRTIEKIIRGFEWAPDDWRAKLLRQKAKQERLVKFDASQVGMTGSAPATSRTRIVRSTN